MSKNCDFGAIFDYKKYLMKIIVVRFNSSKEGFLIFCRLLQSRKCFLHEIKSPDTISVTLSYFTKYYYIGLSKT
jgi:hypothetical protein